MRARGGVCEGERAVHSSNRNNALPTGRRSEGRDDRAEMQELNRDDSSLRFTVWTGAIAFNIFENATGDASG
jgi:hypothetical protein